MEAEELKVLLFDSEQEIAELNDELFVHKNAIELWKKGQIARNKRSNYGFYSEDGVWKDGEYIGKHKTRSVSERV
jgi:hypothetical protein